MRLLLLCLCLAAGASLCPANWIHAQDAQAPHSPQATEPESPQVPAPQSTTPSSPKTTAKEQAVKSDEKKEEKRRDRGGSILIAPMPLVSPAIGSGVIPVAAYIFPFSKNDEVSPPSTVGVAGLITNNGTRAFALGAQLFLKQNTYEVTGGYVQGNLNYDLYGIGIVAGNAGLKLPLQQTGHGYFGEALRRIAWGIFVGPRFLAGDSFLTVRPSSGEVPPPPPDLGIHTTLRALGLRVVRDTRSNHFYPLTGSKVEFTADFFAEALGSKYSFQRYKFQFDKFLSLTKNQVLAYDLYVCDTGGEPPFYANCIYGTSAELRGYTAGRYIDRQMFATQLEYRLSLPKRFGVAGFAGIGEVYPGASQILRSNQFLPAVGGGPRFVLSSKYHVNLRTDFARGKNSWTWSMGVGEAF
jgi:hypothetical protein